MWWTTAVGTALAAGFATGDPGARALGRGGAWVAGADDATAMWWNPAALGTIRTVPRLDLAATSAGARFAPVGGPDEAGVGRGGGVRGAVPLVMPFEAPLVWIGVGAPVDGVAWAWPADGTSRYAATTVRIGVLDVLLGSARRVGPVELGLCAGTTTISLDQRQAATTALGGSRDPAYDVLAHIRGNDGAFVAVGGARWSGGPWSLALAARTPARFRAVGALAVDFTDNAFHTGDSELGQVIAATVVRDERVELPLALPGSIRAGVSRRIGATTVEVSVVYDGWSDVREIRVEDVDLRIATTGGQDLVVDEDVVIPLGLDDTWSVRIGGEHARPDGGRFRLGAGMATAAAPENTRSALIPDGTRWWAGTGVGFTAGRWGVDVAASPQIVRSPRLDHSTVAQVAIDPLTGDVGFGEQVGDGILDAWSVTAAVAITPPVRRDRETPPPRPLP